MKKRGDKLQSSQCRISLLNSIATTISNFEALRLLNLEVFEALLLIKKLLKY